MLLHLHPPLLFVFGNPDKRKADHMYFSNASDKAGWPKRKGFMREGEKGIESCGVLWWKSILQFFTEVNMPLLLFLLLFRLGCLLLKFFVFLFYM